VDASPLTTTPTNHITMKKTDTYYLIQKTSLDLPKYPFSVYFKNVNSKDDDPKFLVATPTLEMAIAECNRDMLDPLRSTIVIENVGEFAI